MVALQTLKSKTPLVIELSGGLACDAFKLLHGKVCTRVWQKTLGPQTRRSNRNRALPSAHVQFVCLGLIYGLS